MGKKEEWQRDRGTGSYSSSPYCGSADNFLHNVPIQMRFGLDIPKNNVYIPSPEFPFLLVSDVLVFLIRR